MGLWLAIGGLLGVVLAPLVLALRRPLPAETRGHAQGFYIAELAELDRERQQGLISPAEHESARLEVARRLLAAAGRAPAVPAPALHRWPILAAAALTSLAAILLYLRVGSPGLPAAPIAARIADARALIARLHAEMSALVGDPTPLWRADIMLGSAEGDRQNWLAAATAWKAALAIHFDATLAAQTAEAETRAHGRVTPDAATLYRRALAAAPADAPWRAAAEMRLKEAAQSRAGR